MSGRRDADRAEAIVKGVGVIVLLGILFLIVRSAPGVLKGKSTDQMLGSMIKVIAGFVGVALFIGLLGLIVWIKVRGGGRARSRHLAPNSEPTSTPPKSAEPTAACPRCGRPMVLKKGRWGSFWGCSDYPNCRGGRE